MIARFMARDTRLGCETRPPWDAAAIYEAAMLRASSWSSGLRRQDDVQIFPDRALQRVNRI